MSKRNANTWSKYDIPKVTLMTIPYSEIDWDKYWNLWRKSKYKPANCYPPIANLFRPYWEMVTGGDLRLLVAMDENDKWIGGTLVRLDPNFKNLCFWKHVDDEKADAIVENMELPEYGVMSTDPQCRWLLGVDICLEELSIEHGGSQIERTYEKAMTSRLLEYEMEYHSVGYTVSTVKWRDVCPNKFRKEVEKGLEKWEYEAKLYDNEEGFEHLDDAFRLYWDKWERNQQITRYRPGDMDNLRNILKAACLDGYGVISTMEVDGCKSVESGFVIPDRNAYIVPFVATELGTKAPIGAMHMAWTMDEMYKQTRALIYDQGTGVTTLKTKWNPNVELRFKLISYGESPELCEPYKRFSWQPKVRFRLKHPKVKSYRVTEKLTTGYARRGLLSKGKKNANSGDVRREGRGRPIDAKGEVPRKARGKAQQNHDSNAA